MRCDAAVLVLAAIGCGSPEPAPTSQLAVDSGRMFRDALVNALEQAEEIVIQEHSHQYDHLKRADDLDAPFVPTVYESRVLTHDQAAEFLSAVRSIDPATRSTFALCIFKPHHTIELRAGGKTVSKMEICFECGQIEWDVTKLTPPTSLCSALASFVTSIGLNPVRDWDELATAAEQSPDK